MKKALFGTGLAILVACVSDEPSPSVGSSSGGTSSGSSSSGGSSSGQSSSSSSSGSSSGGMDAGPRCNPTGAYGIPTPVAELNSSLRESAWISPDELTAYVTRVDSMNKSQVLLAKRSAVGMPFSNPVPATEFATANALQDLYGLTFSNDLLTFYAQKGSSNPTVVVSQRASNTVAFPATQSVFFGSSTAQPYIAPRLNANQTILWATDLGSFKVKSATKLPTAIYAFSDAVNRGTELNVASVSSIQEQTPGAVSGDGMSFYFSTSVGLNNTDVFVIPLGSGGAFAGAPQPVPAVNSTGFDSVVGESADGCALYLSSNRSGNDDLFVAMRGK